MTTSTNNLDPLARMRAMDAKLDEALAVTQDCVDVLEASNRHYERHVRTPDPLPMRPRSGLLWWLLVFATFAFLSGAVFSASYVGAQGVAVNRCGENLADLTDPGLMSRTTARRHGRAWCRKMEAAGGQWWRAIR